MRASERLFLVSLSVLFFRCPERARGQTATTQTVLVNWRSNGWKYYDEGDIGTTQWTTLAYDDTAAGWWNGQGPLGYGDPGITTQVGFGSDLNKHPSTYFRHDFTLPVAPSCVVAVELRCIIDDGGAFYLNGQRVSQFFLLDYNQPTTYQEWAGRFMENDFEFQEYDVHTPPVNPGVLQTGQNVLSVEAKQSGGTSSDLAMDARLIVHRRTDCAAPVTDVPVIDRTTAQWRYDDSGSDWGGTDPPRPTGLDWPTVGFSDSSWSIGTCDRCGFGNSAAESTRLAFGANANDKHTTYYFRHTFDIGPGSPTNFALSCVAGVRASIDAEDGYAIYLNGARVGTVNLNNFERYFGQFTSATLLAYRDEGLQSNTFSLPPQLLREGSNVLAVEVHLASTSAARMAFAADLDVSVLSSCLPPAPTSTTTTSSSSTSTSSTISSSSSPSSSASISTTTTTTTTTSSSSGPATSTGEAKKEVDESAEQEEAFPWLYLVLGLVCVVCCVVLIVAAIIFRVRFGSDDDPSVNYGLEHTNPAGATRPPDDREYSWMPDEEGNTPPTLTTVSPPTNYSRIAVSPPIARDYTLPVGASAFRTPHGQFGVDPNAAGARSRNLQLRYEDLELDQKLGDGAFGEVYKAYWRGTAVAVKKMKASSLSSDGSDLVQEVAIMARLPNHVHVVAIVGFCVDPLCVVTEFVAGGSLESALRTHGFYSYEVSKLILQQICAGMMHLAAENICHKDLSARNVLVSTSREDPCAKVCDFGLARETVATATDRGVVGRHKTEASLGPLRHLAPECMTQRFYSEASDVWAWGVTSLEVYTAKEAFCGKPTIEVARQVVSGELNPASQLPADMPDDVARVVRRSFERDPDSRPTFAALSRDLRAF